MAEDKSASADFNKGIGERVKARMAERGMDVKEVASAAGVGISFLYQVLKGERGVSAANLAKIAEALKCSMEWLCTGISPTSEELTPAERDLVFYYRNTGAIMQHHILEIAKATSAKADSESDSPQQKSEKPHPTPLRLVDPPKHLEAPPLDDDELEPHAAENGPHLYRDDEQAEMGYVKARWAGRVAAGDPYGLSADRLEGWEQVAEDVWLEAGCEGKKPWIVDITGDSMIDEGLESGNLVAFFGKRLPESGELVVAEIEDEGRVVKRYYRKSGRIELQSANEAEAEQYPPRYFGLGEVAIYGVVRARRDSEGEWHPVARVSRKNSTL